MLVHGRHAVQLINNSVAFPHGFALNLHSVCIVNDAVADGISHSGIVEVLMPARCVKLGAKNRRSNFVSGLNQFKQVAGLVLFQRIQQPLVQNEQLHLFIALHHIPVGAVAAGNADLGQYIRESDILDTIEIAVGGDAQRTSEVCRSSKNLFLHD